MNTNLIGRTYGPFTYEVGAEKLREFALGLYGAAPSVLYPHAPPAEMPREYQDRVFAEQQHDGRGLVAPPTFCVNFAMKPFFNATLDPDLAFNLAMLVHGEQEFEFVEPVRSGDVLTTIGTIAELFEKSEKEFVVVQTETRNQHGRIAVRATWTALVRKEQSRT